MAHPEVYKKPERTLALQKRTILHQSNRCLYDPVIKKLILDELSKPPVWISVHWLNILCHRKRSAALHFGQCQSLGRPHGNGYHRPSPLRYHGTFHCLIEGPYRVFCLKEIDIKLFINIQEYNKAFILTFLCQTSWFHGLPTSPGTLCRRVGILKVQV